jgi:hypothetical protein
LRQIDWIMAGEIASKEKIWIENSINFNRKKNSFSIFQANKIIWVLMTKKCDIIFFWILFNHWTSFLLYKLRIFDVYIFAWSEMVHKLFVHKEQIYVNDKRKKHKLLQRYQDTRNFLFKIYVSEETNILLIKKAKLDKNILNEMTTKKTERRERHFSFKILYSCMNFTCEHYWNSFKCQSFSLCLIDR